MAEANRSGAPSDDSVFDAERADHSPAIGQAAGKPAAETGQRQRVRVRRRHHRRYHRLWRTIRWPAISLVACLALLVMLWAALRVKTALAEYHQAKAEIAVLRAIEQQPLSSLSTAQIATARTNLDDVNRHLHRLDSALSLPPGVNWAVRSLPWIGPRYRATRQLLTIGELTSSAGSTLADAGQAAMDAFSTTGVTAKANETGPTWLEALDARQPALDTAANQLAEAEQLRSTLDAGILPGSARRQIATLDRLLSRIKDPRALIDDDLPALRAALGDKGQARYLVLFQNPEELRLGGGFPGTMALVTLEHGQLTSYQIFDGHTLTDNYVRHRTSKLPQPWPIQQYFPQDGFLLQDASWFSNFPTSGATIMEMYRQTTWPPINGVIAVEPAVISDLLRVTGSVTIDVDGEPRHITPQNLMNEIERQRELIRSTKNSSLTPYKTVLELIGETVMQRLKIANRAVAMQALKYLAAGANRRDIQIYASNQQVQSAVERRNWAGQLAPNPNTPNLAVTFANVALSKASLAMQPSVSLSVGPPSNGRRQVTLKINLFHSGTSSEDPFYYGFQKWWVEVSLPKGSQRLANQPAAQPDPQAPNGGGYLIPIYPQQTGHIQVAFSMPATNELLVRRQPGVSTVKLTVTNQACGQQSTVEETRDIYLNLGAVCHTP